MAEMMLNYWNGKGAGKAQGWTVRERVFLSTFVVLLLFVSAMIALRGSGSMPLPKIKAAKGDISALKTALYLFERQNGRFPTTAEGLLALVKDPGGLPNWQPHLDRTTAPLDPWHRAYVYRILGRNGREFDLYSVGSDGVDGTTDDVHDVESVYR